MPNHDDPHDDHKPPFEGRTYLYIRDHPADDGTEPLPSTLPFWLSPDIIVIKPGGIAGGEAIANQLNQVQVIVTNAGGITATDAYVDAFVADPSTAFTPATATLIGGAFLTISGYNTASISFPWTPSPAEAGHRCLLARVNLTIPPDTYVNGAVFDVVGDRHVAQRNIHVVAFAPMMRLLSFGFHLVNPLAEDREFLVLATEVRIGRNIDVVRAALGCDLAQFGETPLADIRLAVGEAIKPRDISEYEPDREAAPVGVLARPANIERTARAGLRMGPNDIRSAVVTVGRNPDTRAGDIHIVQVAQVDVLTRRTVGGFWLAVEH
jgi:hypothetical protein